MARVIGKTKVFRQSGRYGLNVREVMVPVLKCDCGRKVVCGGFTNTCHCGRDYNGSGHLLAPREQWGEETGKSLSDILRIP
jgi:hypothetical protein